MNGSLRNVLIVAGLTIAVGAAIFYLLQSDPVVSSGSTLGTDSESISVTQERQEQDEPAELPIAPNDPGRREVGSNPLAPQGGAAGVVLSATDTAGKRIAPARFLVQEAEDVYWVEAPSGEAVVRRSAQIRNIAAWGAASWSPVRRIHQWSETAPSAIQLQVAEASSPVRIKTQDEQGNPIPNLEARFHFAGLQKGQNDLHGLRNRMYTQTRKQTVPPDGVIHYGDFPAGIYSLEFSSSSHVHETITLEISAGEKFAQTIVLRTGWYLTGNVHSAVGAPIAGASLAILPRPQGIFQAFMEAAKDYPGWNILKSQQLSSGHSTTDEKGRFRIGPLDAKWQERFELNLYAAARGFITAHLELPADIVQNSDVGILQLQPGSQVEVQVVAAGTGETIEKAKVAYFPGERNESLFGNTVDWRPAQETDSDGKVRFEGLPPGRVQFLVIAPGFSLKEQGEDVPPAGQAGNYLVSLTPELSIRGVVLSKLDRTPIAEAKVAPVEYGQVDLMNVVMAESSDKYAVETDAGGQFRMSGLPPGDWALSVRAEAYANEVTESVHLDAGLSEPFVQILLGKGGSIAVTVLDGDDIPDPGQAITLFPLGAQKDSRNAKTDENGLAFFELLPAGSYQLSVSNFSFAEGGLSLLAGGDFSGMRGEAVIVRLAEGENKEITLGGKISRSRVQGFVEQTGRPADGVSVMLGSGATYNSTKTDAEGYYEIEDMPPGEYVLMVGNFGFGSGAGWIESLTLRGEPNVYKNVNIPTHGLEVTVVAADTGEPVANVPVHLRAADGTTGGGFLTTNSDGIALFPYINPGEYALCAGKAVFSIFGTGEDHGSEIIQPVTIPAQQDSMQRIQVQLREPATLIVNVKGNDGAPIVGAGVYYLDEQGQPLSQFNMTGTNGEGRVKLSSLPAGRGRILVRHYEFGQTEAEVDLRGGKTEELELQLETGVRLYVLPVDAQGNPLAGIQVIALDERRSPVSALYTGMEAMAMAYSFLGGGEQDLGPLKPGRYTLVLSQAGKPKTYHKVELEAGARERHLTLQYP